MSDPRQSVLTIGHSTHSLEAFLKLLQRHDVSAVADVRSVPYSRFNPQYNRESLTEALEAAGIRYVYLGRELGGRRDDPACYEDGRLRYDRVAATTSFKSGLVRVVRGIAKHRIALMCAEKEPLDCHRTLLVSRALDELGIDVAHIHADGQLEPHGDAMERLLGVLNLPREDLYRSRAELIATAVALRSDRFAHAGDNSAAPTEGRGS